MGLDQYAYVANCAGERDEWYEGATFDKESKDFINPKMVKPKEIAYWRKHPNLQGWMEQLWRSKLGEFPGGSFNNIELELTWDDVDRLEKDIKKNKLAKLRTTGFFFGEPSDKYYKAHDLEFCKNAKAELFLGLKVFYNSSW